MSWRLWNSVSKEGLAMDLPPTIVLELTQWSPPLFRVISVDRNVISESNLTIGEQLTDTDLDYIMDILSGYGVEIRYPP
jgi:hypothetical protein